MTPLNGLAARALRGLARDYREGATAVPSLSLWADLLRVVPEDGLPKGELPTAARISKRAATTVPRGAIRLGLAIDDGADGRLRLTDLGRRAKAAAERRLRKTEQAWADRYPAATDLRRHLYELVTRFDLELPHFPIGYGTADNSVTGGSHRKAQPGPPAIPSHGQDWVPVVRTEPPAGDLPLTALLSQTHVAFAIDFEGERGSLPTTVLFQDFDATTGERRAADLPGGDPGGWERHGLVTIDPAPMKKHSVIRLTAIGRALRDRYVPRTTAIEERWRQRYGDGLVTDVRRSLQDLVAQADLTAELQTPLVTWIGGLREA